MPAADVSAGAGDGAILKLDAHTREDLRLFDADGAGTSLFSFCNGCRTAGGEKVLQRRMLSPWSDPDHIRATQAALLFVLEQREAFAHLPSAFVGAAVSRYSHESLPVVRQDGLEFALGAFTLWFYDDRFYVKIARGVLFTCRIIRALRKLVEQAPEGTSAGELAPLLAEMRTLLARPLLARVPDDDPGRWFWEVLRLDQAFRLYEQTTLDRLLEITWEMDALVAMADATGGNGFVMPDIETGPVHVSGEGVVHPFVPDAVANPVDLSQQRRVLFLTGPNMAGKTTYLRAVATALYLAHLGMGVPARSFRFVPVQRLLTSISLGDDLDSGVSYFRAEALRMKAVAQAVADGERVVAIMDEPFKGTNVKDAFDASLAILQRLAASPESLFLVASHLIELSESLGGSGQVDFRYFEAEEQQDRLRFDYVLHAGVSSQRLGMRVLREEGIFDLLDGAPGE